MDNKHVFDIIIPVAYKDYAFLKKSILYISKNIEGIRRIFLITRMSMAKYLSNEITDNPLVMVIDEDSIIEGLSYKRIDSIIRSQGRKHTNTGWYFQQFLKMAFSYSKYCVNPYYLSWDADTIPVQKLSMFDKNGHPYFSIKSEYHEPYFIAIRNLLGIEKCNNGSYIAEHMLFQRDIMQEIISKIESSDISGEVWYEKILNSIVPELISTHAFSEFETYGTYCMTCYPELYVERVVPSFRRGALIQGRFVSDRILHSLSSDVTTVSFEIYDRPPFPWGRICGWYEKWLKKKELFLLNRNL